MFIRTLLLSVALSFVTAPLVFASDWGKYCTNTLLERAGTMEVCRGLHSSTYSDGGRDLNVRFVLNDKADCRKPFENLPATMIWVRSGRGEAILTNIAINDYRAIPVAYIVENNFDAQNTCRVEFRYSFSDYNSVNEFNPRIRSINQAIMSDVRTDIEFGVALNGIWDNRAGYNYRVYVKQYGDNNWLQ